jgi:Flp pilus assembly protein TadD
MSSAVREGLEAARRLAAAGRDEEAKAAYIAVLRLDAANFFALNELATLALATGHRSAARTAYRQAVLCHPANPVGRVNLGNVYFEDGELAAARGEYEAALAADGDFVEAHQGLARTLDELGDPATANLHRQRGFAGHALVAQPYRGSGAPVRVLLLVSSRFGNVSTRLILDNKTFDVWALYADFHDPAQPLPPHAVVFNAIGDADLCEAALERASAVTAATSAPVINAPGAVALTGRVENAQRLASVAGLICPRIRARRREDLAADSSLRFPLLLRSPGFHMGSHFQRVERREELAEAMSALPGEELLEIEYLDARGADGMVRKYRVMIIDGVVYPLHLAIAADWKVHYFSAPAMGTEPRYREEERHFLEAMPEVLGPRALAALTGLGERMGLDYAGVDFGLRADGCVLLFEANATMVIVPPPPDPLWDYRRAAINSALEAARRLVLARAGSAHRHDPAPP